MPVAITPAYMEAEIRLERFPRLQRGRSYHALMSCFTPDAVHASRRVWPTYPDGGRRSGKLAVAAGEPMRLAFPHQAEPQGRREPPWPPDDCAGRTHPPAARQISSARVNTSNWSSQCRLNSGAPSSPISPT